MCVRVGGKKGLSFLSSLSQVVILSDYFRFFFFFFPEFVATGLHKDHNLPFFHPTVKGGAGATMEVEGLDTSMKYRQKNYSLSYC